MAGMLGFGIGLFFMTSIGPLVLIPYLFASISFLVGMRVFNAFVDRKGNLKGHRLLADVYAIAAYDMDDDIDFYQRYFI